MWYGNGDGEGKGEGHHDCGVTSHNLQPSAGLRRLTPPPPPPPPHPQGSVAVYSLGACTLETPVHRKEANVITTGRLSDSLKHLIISRIA